MEENQGVRSPPSYLSVIVMGLLALREGGIRYPIAHLGPLYPAGPIIDSIYGGKESD